MERRFDMSDFEQSLKDHADQFSLIPSKRVWNGIYNNLHPGSKWPSITVAIILLIILVTVGNLNNSKKSSKNNELATVNANSKATNNGNFILHNTETIEKNTQNLVALKSKLSKSENGMNKNISANKSENKITNGEEILSKENIYSNKNKSANNLDQIAPSATVSEKNNLIKQEEITLIDLKNNDGNTSPESEKALFTPVVEVFENLQPTENPATFKAGASFEKNISIISVSPYKTSVTKTSFPSDFETNQPANLTAEKTIDGNKPNTKKPLRKRNKNVEWTFYVTPLISSVSFDKKTVHLLASPNSSIVLLPNQTSSFQLIHNARLGFEAGAEMSYKISKKLGMITGLNLNYSSYNNISNLVHPTFGTLILTDKSGNYAKSYLTHYGNGQSPSQISLTNYNVDVSIPVGLQYNIWSNGKIRIDVSSVIAPSAVLKSNAYMISSDGRYYINEPSLIRKFNMGAAFGSYISFNMKKIKWHVGPDFRYQLLSTYKNIYPDKEHFIDYGIRIGISK